MNKELEQKKKKKKVVSRITFYNGAKSFCCDLCLLLLGFGKKERKWCVQRYRFKDINCSTYRLTSETIEIHFLTENFDFVTYHVPRKFFVLFYSEINLEQRARSRVRPTALAVNRLRLKIKEIIFPSAMVWP